jgi:hypothetical protein
MTRMNELAYSIQIQIQIKFKENPFGSSSKSWCAPPPPGLPFYKSPNVTNPKVA